jgi:phosphatidylserine/phosphatidylglycerophosphate/cardiolipin synthase-like enzyme
MGGFDVCYGRYDTHDHPVDSNDPQYYPGIDYNNCRIKDFSEVREYKKDGLDRDRPRMPWHDVGLRLENEIVHDICNHFIEYWNYASFQTHYEDRYVLILDKEQKNENLMVRIKEGIEGFRNFGKKKQVGSKPKENSLKQSKGGRD